MDFKPVLFAVGALLTILAAAMLLPAAVDLAYGSSPAAFLMSSIITFFFGVSLLILNKQRSIDLNLRQAFLLTNLIWFAIAVCSALPFLLSDLGLTLGEAFFEAMSGITTTGSTILTGLDEMPKGLLFWRGLLQWLGGVGIVVMAMSVLPMLQIGGMQLFRTEGFEQSDKALPRATEIASSVIAIYALFTLAGFLAYSAAGMDEFDAIVHAMTSIATGGFSNHDASMGFFSQGAIPWITVVLMILGSLPFMLYLSLVRDGSKGWRLDSQSRWFLLILGVLILVMALWLMNQHGDGFYSAIKLSAFNVTSIMTGTGYATADYSSWGALPNGFFFMIMFLGGCAGSTTCGLKIFRVQVLFASAHLQLRQLLEPRGVFVSSYDGQKISPALIQSVTGFFFLFLFSFAILAVALSATGLDFITAISAAATAICNVGPGLGPSVGPAGTFADLTETAKWLMAAGMLIGRLEIYSVLILVLPAFWRP